ncbi:NHL repeat-containing protein 2-like isoform X2 [Oscarella lobularis]
MKNTAMFSNPSGLAVHHKARKIYLTDTGNHCIRSVDIETGGVSTLVGAAREHGFVDGIGPKAQFKTPQGICIDERRNLLYVSDTDNHVIRRIHIDTREVVTISGTFRKHGNEDGTGSEARFYHPTALTYNSEDDILYVSDHYNHLVRKIESPDRLPIVSTLAGSVQGHKDGFGKNAQFDYPEGIAYDSVHQLIYVTEFENDCIRFVTKEGNVGTLAGGGKRGSENGEGKVASFFHPTGMAYDPTRNILFVTDQYNHKVRSISILKVEAQPKTSWSFSNVLVIGFACVTTFSVTCYFVSKKRSMKRGRKWID